MNSLIVYTTLLPAFFYLLYVSGCNRKVTPLLVKPFSEEPSREKVLKKPVSTGPVPARLRSTAVAGAVKESEEEVILNFPKHLQTSDIMHTLPSLCARYAVIKNKLRQCSLSKSYGSVSREKKLFEEAMKYILSKAQLGDMIFNYCYEDYAIAEHASYKRGLYLSKASHPIAYDIAAPDWDFVATGGFKPWPERLNTLLESAARNPFDERLNTLFFRGKFTGRMGEGTGRPSLKDPLQNPRYRHFAPRYCSETQKFTRINGISIDIACTGRSPEISDSKLRKVLCDYKGAWSKTVPMADHCKYKYLLSADGRGTQGIRLKELMACGSVVFMHESKHNESFYHLIQPWVHVIPYSHDASDLYEKLRWAAQHPEKAKEIAENGQKLIREKVSESYAVDWWKAFNKMYEANKPPESAIQLCGV